AGLFREIAFLSQGCEMTSLYSADAFEVPNGYTLPYIAGQTASTGNLPGNPYASAVQSRNLRVIATQLDPVYKVKNDTAEFNADYVVNPALTLSSQTAFNTDFLYSTEDYNRFNTAPGVFSPTGSNPYPRFASLVNNAGVFCDPQLGCSDR